MKICEFISEMDILYPKSISAEWDMDGLQCSADPERELRRVLVALDATLDVVEYAVKGKYDLLLTHHPMIFGNTGYIVPDTLYGTRVLKLLGSGVSAASFHTRLDAGDGGVNDCLAEIFDLAGAEPFGDSEMPTIGRIGDLKEEMSASDFAELVKKKLNVPSVRITGNGKIKRVAVLGGAGKDLIVPAKAVGADAILTGEVSYNAALDLSESGIVIIEGGHYYTEYPVCKRLAGLARSIAGAEADIYEKSPQTIFM